MRALAGYNGAVQELVTNLAEGPAEQPVPKSNAGRFQPGDRRINREGRPRGSRKAACEDGSPPADCAPRADRVMLLVVPERRLAHRLSRAKGFWFVNLAEDYEIVACRLDASKGVVFTIRSQTFARVARGAPIPEFAASTW